MWLQRIRDTITLGRVLWCKKWSKCGQLVFCKPVSKRTGSGCDSASRFDANGSKEIMKKLFGSLEANALAIVLAKNNLTARLLPDFIKHMYCIGHINDSTGCNPLRFILVMRLMMECG